MSNKSNLAASLALPENEPVARVFSQSTEFIALIRSTPMGPPEPIGTAKYIMQLPVAGKILNFQRKSTDPVSQVLSRMRISCANAIKSAAVSDSEPPKKVHKPKGGEIVEQPEVSFLTDSSEALTECTLGEAVRLAVSVKVNADVYSLVVDPPLATSLELTQVLFGGFPTVATWTGVGAPEDEFVFEWRVLRGDDTTDVMFTHIGGQVFTPSIECIGNFVEVRCFHPKHPHFFLSTVSVDKVVAHKSGARLSQPLPVPSASIVRVASFNVLAQPYVRTALAQDAYYTHLHSCWQLTDWSRRSPLIMREMADSRSDIFCLQEVAGGAHELQFKRLLESLNHEFRFFGKASAANNGNPIGVSISLNRAKFEVIATHKFNLGCGEDSLLQSMLSEAEKDAISAQFGSHFFGPVLKGIHTICGVVEARVKSSGNRILVGNTHLFFHPFGGHIRILQALCFMRKLDAMRQGSGLIVCGDFNSRPNSGSFQVMHTGQIAADNTDWQYGQAFRAERAKTEVADSDPDADEAGVGSTTEVPPGAMVEGIALSHELAIDHIPSTIPELTHATAAFRSTLDYIFYTKDAFVPIEGPGTGSAIPDLTNAEVDVLGGLPAGRYGSDHVLVCGDLELL